MGSVVRVWRGLRCIAMGFPHALATLEFKMKIQTLIAALILAAGGTAFAQTTPSPAPTVKDPTATPGLDKRQAEQQKRIDQGVASGQLNDKEAARLRARETKLEADKQAAKADGKVTAPERKKLHREAHRDSKAIHRQKHDRQNTAPAR